MGEGRFRSISYAKPRRRESVPGRLRRGVSQLRDQDMRHAWGIDDWYDPAITRAVLDWHEQEQAFFSRLTPRPVVTVGHLVCVRDCFVPYSSHAAPRLMIVGSANELNVEGLNRFLDEDWTALKAELPHCELVIAGGVGKHLPASVSFPEDVTVLVFVEDLAGAYRMADIIVNPVRSGTGLNIKSIEAIGYGKPLLTTPSGSRGLESGIGTAFLCAESPTAFVECVRMICYEAGYAARLSVQALKFARDWNSVALASLSQMLLSHDEEDLALKSSSERT